MGCCRALAGIWRVRGRRGSNTERADRITRAEAFMAQANQIRQQDPAAARSLLERAESCDSSRRDAAPARSEQ